MKIDCCRQDKLSFFKDLFEEARSQAEALNEKLTQHLEQYKGSTKIDGSNVEATQVRNITYELVESQVTSYIPSPSVSPKMQSEKNERNAKSIEVLLRNKRNELPFEKLNDIDERFNPIYGGSVWLVEWDNSIVTHNSVGDVKVSCLNPRNFIGQPNVFDVNEMEYCFITFETTKEDIVRKYGVSIDEADDTESETNYSDDNTATLFVCYYKNDDDKVCEFVWSGDVALLDVEDYYSRKRYVCKSCGKRKELCNCEKPAFELVNEEYEELTHDIVLSDGSVIPAVSEVIENGQPIFETVKEPLYEDDGSIAFERLETGGYLPISVDVEVPKTEPTKIPFYMPDTLPVVIRKNTSQENSLLGQSDCEFIRPQQQAINKIESRILEKLLRAGVYPVVPEDATISLNNSVFGTVIKARQENYHLFGKVDMSVDISKDIHQSERLYDQAKRILGINDSFQGQYDSSAQSGRAKQIQVQQAAGRLDSKRRMKNAAYAEIDRIIFQYYLAYADEPRPATFKDANGVLQNCMFNRYEFIERDESGEYYYNDEYLFSADSAIDMESSRETLWQENRQNFQSGAYGDPALPQTRLVFWQNMEQAHYPWARDNVERIKAEIENQRQIEAQQNRIAELEGEIASRKQYEEELRANVYQQ